MAGRQLNSKAFGERLAKASKEKGLTQEKIGERLERDYNIKRGTSVKTISNHWTGEAVPPLETVFAYCDMLDVTADWLLFGDGEKEAGRPVIEDTNELLDRWDLKTCLKSLFAFMLLSKSPLEEYGAGFWLEGNAFDEQNTSVFDARMVHTKGLDYYDDPHFSINFYNRDSPIDDFSEWDSPIDDVSEWQIWRTFLEQFEHIRKMGALPNSQKMGLAENVIDAYINAFQLAPSIVGGFWLKENDDEQNNS